MKYTKKQRHEIYKKALKWSLTGDKYACGENIIVPACPNRDNYKKYLPELWMVNATTFSDLNMGEKLYMETQQNALMFCIEMTR